MNKQFKVGDCVRILHWGALVEECLLPKKPDNIAEAITILVRLATLAGCEAEIHMIDGDTLTLTNFSYSRYKYLYINCGKRFCRKSEV